MQSPFLAAQVGARGLNILKDSGNEIQKVCLRKGEGGDFHLRFLCSRKERTGEKRYLSPSPAQKHAGIKRGGHRKRKERKKGVCRVAQQRVFSTKG